MADAGAGPSPAALAAAAAAPASRRDAGRGAHGCRHYRRRARLVAPCCGEVFWCRHCHNEARDAGEPDWEKKHELDRSTVAELVCALCETRQPVGVVCANAACGAAFGAFACAACPFFDDDLSKETFHCEACGICRVGGCARGWWLGGGGWGGWVLCFVAVVFFLRAGRARSNCLGFSA
jgi:hypothetical protein